MTFSCHITYNIVPQRVSILEQIYICVKISIVETVVKLNVAERMLCWEQSVMIKLNIQKRDTISSTPSDT